MFAKTCKQCGVSFTTKRSEQQFCCKKCGVRHTSDTSKTAERGIERIMNRVEKQENGCWLFTGHHDRGGYGMMQFKGKMQLTHRLVWMLTHNMTSLPRDLHVCHACDNPPCVNPAHLFLGTHRDNMQDMVNKGRKTYKAVLGEEVSSHKLTSDDVRAIRARYQAGSITYRRLADEYRVSQGTIADAVTRKTWQHIP